MVKCAPLSEGVPEGKAQGNSLRLRDIFYRVLIRTVYHFIMMSSISIFQLEQGAQKNHDVNFFQIGVDTPPSPLKM